MWLYLGRLPSLKAASVNCSCSHEVRGGLPCLGTWDHFVVRGQTAVPRASSEPSTHGSTRKCVLRPDPPPPGEPCGAGSWAAGGCAGADAHPGHLVCPSCTSVSFIQNLYDKPGRDWQTGPLVGGHLRKTSGKKTKESKDLGLGAKTLSQ